MNYPTIEELKAHVRIETDDTLDDELLLSYRDSAIEFIKSYLNCNIYEDSVPEWESNGTVFNLQMKQAVYLMVGQWYRYREDTATSDMHPISVGVKQLLERKRVRNV